MIRRFRKGKMIAGVAGLLMPLSLLAQEKAAIPPGTPVNITVQPAAPSAPPITIVPGPRHGHVIPERRGCTHTGGGNIDVVQPTPDVLVVTMSGAAVAYGSICPATAAQAFELEQCFELSFDNPKVKKGKLTMEGRVIGLLRSHCPKDSAAYDNACAAVSAEATPIPTGQPLYHSGWGNGMTVNTGPACILQLCVPPHAVGGKQALSVNDHDGPYSVPVTAGKYVLRQTFHISTTAHATIVPIKGPSAEFAPDPAIDPLWLSYKEPFHGAIKKDFGFQFILRVAEETEPEKPENGAKMEKPEQPSREKLPEPTPVKP
ncbi:MAG TPA: hypothetical protein VMF69_03485 [Gemmataceae bacterium]|nr:hypothetical protein [Gemmataceae bacterium]